MLSNLQEDIHTELLNTWKRFPELRFGQLIVNILGNDPFYMWNREVLERIKAYPSIPTFTKCGFCGGPIVIGEICHVCGRSW